MRNDASFCLWARLVDASVLWVSGRRLEAQRRKGRLSQVDSHPSTLEPSSSRRALAECASAGGDKKKPPLPAGDNKGPPLPGGAKKKPPPTKKSGPPLPAGAKGKAKGGPPLPGAKKKGPPLPNAKKKPPPPSPKKKPPLPKK